MNSANVAADVALLEIRGMTCSHCESTVSSALTEAGARVVRVDHRSGRAMVENGATDESQLRQALAQAGYRLAAIRHEPAATDLAGSINAHQADRADLSPMGVGMGLGVAALMVVCCAGPLLLASLVAGGAGAWLAANGAVLVGVGAMLAAVAIGAVAVWRRR